MGGLGIVFIVLPISIILLLLWGFSRKKIFVQTLKVIWGGIILLSILSELFKPLFTKKVLEKSDYYGEYIIDRNYFSGKQSDWQYNSYRFEIKENDSIYFYVTDEEKIKKTYVGTISTISPYQSARLVIEMEEPTHHILTTNPTIYRNVWNYFMVFNSPKFHNMYFRKGEWKKIE